MKKRVMLTLTASNVEKLQKLFKDHGLPSGTLSSLVDDYIKEQIKVMESIVESGKFSFKDMFTIFGQKMDEVIKQEEQDISN